MDKQYGVYALVGICILVLGIGVMRRKAELLLNFLVRMVVGVLLIYCVNEVLMSVGIAASVGINPISVLTVGGLGAGGLGLLYGIVIYQML